MSQQAQRVGAVHAHGAVRIESDTSIGRSYSRKAGTVPGLGAKRRALETRSWPAPADGACPVLESATLLATHLERATREDIRSYFHNTWALTDTLFSALKNDSVFYMVPDALRRPLIFYCAHPAALYVNKMHEAGLMDHINPYLQKLFETGVDEMSWDDMDVMQQEDFAWPDVAEAVAFRAAVKAGVDAVIDAMPVPAEGHAITPASQYWALVMGFEHERIHLETSSVLTRQLPAAAVAPPRGWRHAPSFAPRPQDAPANSLAFVPAARVTLGKPADFPSFGWDNEYGARAVDVPPFAAGRLLVSNAEFLPFVEAGGYAHRAWWVSPEGDDEGWRWATFRNATHPSFWVAPAHADFARFLGGKPGAPYQKDDGDAAVAGTEPRWRLRAQFEVVPLPWDWPVEVNHHEAAAFMRWKAATEGAPGVSYRFPTEAEYHAGRGDASAWPAWRDAARGAGARPAGADAGDGRGGPAGNGRVAPPPAGAAPDAAAAACDVMMAAEGAPGNVNFRFHSPTPVDYYAPSRAGLHDTHGNVWEWAEDHFAPLPGFEYHYLYDDFSAPCFDGWHTVILGGSWASTGDLGSSFARYHFRRHFFQHLGFRYVRRGAPGDGPREAFAGEATVANLWERGTRVAAALTDGYAPPEELAGGPAAAAALGAPSAPGLAYPAELARAAARAYAAHGRAPAGAGAGAGAGAPPPPALAVLHIGCGAGGGTFELARAFPGARVLGVSDDEAEVRHARILQHHGQFGYERAREGVLVDAALARAPGSPADRARVRFVHTAGELTPAEAAGRAFDVVIVDGALTRARQPLDVLALLRGALRGGGVALVASDNDWDPAVTPRNSWLGGFKMNGEEQSTLTMLRHALKRAFVHAGTADLPRVTRAHARRFRLDVLELTTWRRRDEELGPGAVDAEAEGDAAAAAAPAGCRAGADAAAKAC